MSVPLVRTCPTLGEMLGLGCSVEGREGGRERGRERERERERREGEWERREKGESGEGRRRESRVGRKE